MIKDLNSVKLNSHKKKERKKKGIWKERKKEKNRKKYRKEKERKKERKNEVDCHLTLVRQMRKRKN